MSWLRRPWWPVPATRKVQHSWRVVEIALADAGVHREAGDTATSLVRRAVHLDLLDRDTLLVCAAVVDRVQHGLGVHEGDLQLARRTAEMTYQTVWDELDERQKLVAMYRPL